MIRPNSPLPENATSRATRGFFERVYPLWSKDDVLKHLGPIRNCARKAARSGFDGTAIVAASARLEQAGIPANYGLSTTAREYAVFQNCEQLVAIFASRVGNPQIAPVPPLWPLLALVLFEWRATISGSGVVARAASLGLSEEAQRGLVIVRHLFPELQDWLAEVPLAIPLWERVLAVPLAARKLVLLEKTS